jgi:hypothetical protein
LKRFIVLLRFFLNFGAVKDLTFDRAGIKVSVGVL